MSPALLAQLTGAGGALAGAAAAGIDIQVVQWGVSPYNETSGLGNNL
jgi:hypothetical protein